MYNESEWLKLLFMLSDMQAWINQMEKDLLMQVPGFDKKKLFRPTYYISASSFAHIIERHYHKIVRHMGVGKFIIPVPDILYWLRLAAQQASLPIPGSLNFYRELDTQTQIGFDKNGNYTSVVTVITDARGCIKTAFPGHHKDRSALSWKKQSC